ncbi:MAG: NifB/NifX family molybdenum-iron cluster-binding protein [Desulfococcaceae bacterium]|jgi:predicted Fe-Mo cluster-binding NifX family protein|nr:NifB/NifX family molybdenum-iron cluster-binding protein [Desulfococcaceae bacterium]
MKIAFPTSQEGGPAGAMENPVHDHFGSAGFFVIVDSETGESEIIRNRDRHHKHGECQPGRFLGSAKVDAIIAGGMGKGALSKLSKEGIAVYRGIEGSVSENLALFKKGKLPAFTMDQTCTDADHHHCC